ncbi:13920_t:CDS:2 [Funneliformis caledonium]|uniref:13920_t:CDS:1 n=1 Tax=Funneliformis caledonium TaxID=1117310 RepID=A0A9N9GXV4_9GLOM|nr:13920_t:CDS:2 [Funneliformis caledonium]
MILSVEYTLPKTLCKVNFYAEKFKRLLKKVNSTNVLLDKYIVRLFLNRLKKNIILLIAFSQPKNVDEVIEVARLSLNYAILSNVLSA